MFQLNWLDLFLGVGILIGIITGFLQGMLRQGILLASVYVGAILATQYYSPLARWAKTGLPTTPWNAIQAAAFFFIFFIATLIISILARDAFRNTKFKTFALLDSVAGAFLGGFNGWVLLSLLLLPASYAVGTESWGTYEWIRLGLENALNSSFMAALLKQSLPTIVQAVKPFLPLGLTSIFDF